MEFESKQEMEITIDECRDFMEQKLCDIQHCGLYSCGVTQLMWMALWEFGGLNSLLQLGIRLDACLHY